MTCVNDMQPVLASISWWHIVVLLAIMLLLFGGKKLPELARGLAKSVRIFRDEMHGVSKDIETSVENPPPQAPQAKQDQVPQDGEKKDLIGYLSAAPFNLRSDSHMRKTGFTLVELLVVIAILTMLFMLLAPSLQSALEEGRISNCGSIIHHMGNALSQYVAANRDTMPPFVSTDQASYDYLMTVCVVDQYGNVWNPTYQSAYIYRNLIGTYMGLGDCMPGHADNYWSQYLRWEAAMYTHFKEYTCPSGVKMTSPYGWAVDPATGRGEGQCYYAQNVSWTSQSHRISGAEWPMRSAYFPLFTNTSSAILLYEQWSGNGGAGGSSDSNGQPYNTHYRNGSSGAQGIGRNILYADWHCTFLRTGDQTNKPFMLWNTYPAIRRGNDMGIPFNDQWQGRSWISWDLYQPLKEKG